MKLLVGFIIYLVCFPLAANQLTVGVFDEHPLYLKTSKPYAVGWEILSQAAQSANIELIPVEEGWARSIVALKNKRIDGIYGAMMSEERKEWANFSLPISSDLVYVFSEPNTTSTQLEQIDRNLASVGVSKDSIQHQLAIEMGFKNIYAIIDRNVLYKMLLAGRIDYLIYSDSFVNVYCYKYNKQQQQGCLQPVKPALASNTLHLMYLKNNSKQPLYDKLNKALIALESAGTIKSIFEKYHQSNEAYQAWFQQWQIMVKRK